MSFTFRGYEIPGRPWHWILLALVVFGWALGQDSKNHTTSTSVPKTTEQLRKERIAAHFSDWDGSHRASVALIKKSMNNPNSFKHVETVYWDRGDYLVVKTTFRGTNAFGGVVTNWVKTKCDLNGDVLEVIEQGQ